MKQNKHKESHENVTFSLVTLLGMAGKEATYGKKKQGDEEKGSTRSTYARMLMCVIDSFIPQYIGNVYTGLPELVSCLKLTTTTLPMHNTKTHTQTTTHTTGACRGIISFLPASPCREEAELPSPLLLMALSPSTICLPDCPFQFLMIRENANKNKS